MADLLCLSLWVRGFEEANALRHFEKLLRVFPFSRLRPGIAGMRVYAMEFVEPPLAEVAYAEGADVEAVIAGCREYQNPDCVYVVDGWWELWKFDAGWELRPSQVSLLCFGPQFENDEGDQLRLELGPETDFLPEAEAPDSGRKAQSNLRGLLRLVREIENSLPLERRSLWSESGENFAERLENLVAGE